jgi:2,5-diamino-6-(ribosylamino)-4(3H)-pyrimidinone 5'-phosphate reductase
MPTTDIARLSNVDETFLSPYLPPCNPNDQSSGTPKRHDFPFVTLTYACSLDGMIALAPGVRTSLSGLETKSMTHYLRLKHDAILVGAGTAVADAPSLNCRYPGADLDAQPRPVIVDPRGRWQMDGSAVYKLAEEGRGKEPWVVGLAANGNKRVPDLGLDERDDGVMEWEEVLKALKSKGIDSVMIEGGATIINTLILRPDLVDSVIVTIAPTWLGQGGLPACPSAVTEKGQRVNAARLSDTAWRQFGADAVLCGKLGC